MPSLQGGHENESYWAESTITVAVMEEVLKIKVVIATIIVTCEKIASK